MCSDLFKTGLTLLKFILIYFVYLRMDVCWIILLIQLATELNKIEILCLHCFQLKQLAFHMQCTALITNFEIEVDIKTMYLIFHIIKQVILVQYLNINYYYDDMWKH